MHRLIVALALLLCSPAFAQWSYPSTQYQIGGVAQSGVTTLNAPAGSTLSGGVLTIVAGGSGTVTSVGLALPAIFTISGSPVSTTGTLTGTFASQSQNLFLASPNGSSGAPSMRAVAANDLPATLNASTFPSVTLSNATNQATLGTAGHVDVINAAAPAAVSNTLVIPDTGGNDTFAFLALAQTFTNKTISGGTFSGTIAGTPTISGAWTWSVAQTFLAVTLSNATNQIVAGTTNTDTLNFAAPAASRVITFGDPGGADSVAYLAASQTFTNKTESSPTLSGTVAGTPMISSAWTWSSAQTFPAVTLSNATNQATLGAAGHVDVISATAPAAAANTLTIPDTAGNDTFVFASLAQTLASKTLTAPVINGLTSSGSTAIDFSGNSSIFKPSTGGVQGSANEDFGCNGNCSFGNAAANNTITIGKTTTMTVISGTQRTHRVTVADAAYSMVLGDRIVAYTSITAGRTVTLIPQANCSSAAPCDWWVSNESGSVQTIIVAASSGNINGGASAICTALGNGGCSGYCNGTDCFMTFSR